MGYRQSGLNLRDETNEILRLLRDLKEQDLDQYNREELREYILSLGQIQSELALMTSEVMAFKDEAVSHAMSENARILKEHQEKFENVLKVVDAVSERLDKLSNN